MEAGERERKEKEGREKEGVGENTPQRNKFVSGDGLVHVRCETSFSAMQIVENLKAKEADL